MNGVGDAGASGRTVDGPPVVDSPPRGGGGTMKSSEFRSRTVRIHGHEVSYRMAGEGPTILLVHGIAGSSTTWRAVMPALAEHYTVIA
ncbi:MAG TPA: hypothetical protein VFC03_02630, partial [Acidimicrobiales bacterium]|nr:hypothetical protein [Acidimicrobiales bacterium]